MFSAQALLSKVAKERCIAKLKDLPSFFFNDGNKTQASVLIPLCVVNEEVCLLYTLRSTNLKNHSGQVSFPGGKQDEGENVFETALRETEEEIGVSRHDIDIWTQMPQVQGRDKTICITPVVGVIKNFDYNKLKRSIDEVEEIFTVPMSSLCDMNHHAHFTYQKHQLPIYLYGNYKIWGITGIMTHLFLTCFLPSGFYNANFLRKEYQFEELIQSKL